jgi:FAD/FMN-containing dehydrogenase
MVTGGLVLHPRSKAKEVLSFFREFMETAPDELTAYCGLLTAPDGAPVVAIIGCYSGPVDAGETAMRPLKEFGPPVADLIGPIPHTQMQSMLDAAFPPGNRNYWRSTFLNGLSDELFDVLIEYAGRMASPLSALVIEHYGGAASRVGDSETAFPHRSYHYNLNMFASWVDPAQSEQHIQWARDVSQAVGPYAVDGVYVNFLGDEGEDRVKASFGKNYDRLVEIKKKYDPTNLFRLNQNIKPSS